MGVPKFLTRDDLLVAEGYNRIVKTEQGEEYYEFEDHHIAGNIHIPDQAKWRLDHDHAFYEEYRSKCNQYVKLYHQIRPVNYADYKIGRWYISVYDVIMEHDGVVTERRRMNKVDDFF